MKMTPEIEQTIDSILDESNGDPRGICQWIRNSGMNLLQVHPELDSEEAELLVLKALTENLGYQIEMAHNMEGE